MVRLIESARRGAVVRVVNRGLVLVLAFSACRSDADVDPEREALEEAIAAICEYREECECGFSRARCTHELRNQLDVALAMASEQGRGLDLECVGRFVDLFPTLGCRKDADVDEAYLESVREELAAAFSCDAFVGSAEVGAECSFDPVIGSPCRPGAGCHHGECVALIELAAVGEPCTDAYVFACEDDLGCADLEGDGQFVCVTPVPEGEPCLGSTFFCGHDLECRGGRCVPYPALGEGCTGRCSGDASCRQGVCVARPGQGDACNVTCAEGLDCDVETNVCVPERPVVCELLFFGSTDA